MRTTVNDNSSIAVSYQIQISTLHHFDSITYLPSTPPIPEKLIFGRVLKEHKFTKALIEILILDMASFPNIWNHRKVADTASKPCEICYKPSASVLITPENKVDIDILYFEVIA